MDEEITDLSDLHRDIWYEIFGYFYADELFHTFLGVLNEINLILLNDFHLRFHVRIDYELTSKILSKINPNQILSISIEEMENNNNTNIKQMIYLRSISIKGSNTDGWMEHLCQQMILLQNITRISLTLIYNNRGSYLFDLILRIPNLKEVYFNDRSNWEMITKLNSDKNLYFIEKVYLNFYCYFESIEKMIFSSPYLQIIQLKLFRDDTNSSIENSSSKNQLNYLKKLHLTLCDTSFNLIILFFQIIPNISKIILDGNIWGTNVIDYFQIENWWKILSFLNKNNKQKIIYVDLDLRQDYSNLSTNNIGIINYFEFEKIGLQVTLYTIKGCIKL